MFETLLYSRSKLLHAHYEEKTLTKGYFIKINYVNKLLRVLVYLGTVI